MMIPEDPDMLCSYLNTQMRNRGCSLKELCAALGLSREEVQETLKKAGYSYSEEYRRFI